MNMLTRPKPLPEELDRGYLGRAMRINGYRTETELFEAIATNFGMPGRTRRELPTTQMAAMTAGLSTEQFVLHHTTLPIRRSITSYHPEVPHGSLDRSSILFASGMGTARRGWYFCQDCVKEDIGFHGVSYWRRDLQVPGQLWCLKHGTPLRYVLDAEAVLKTPMAASCNSEVVATSIARAAARNQCVVR